MKRNDVAVISELKVGDRFYKANDKKKTVFVVVEGEKKQTFFQTYKYFACAASIVDNKALQQYHKERSYAALKKDTQVIFLRHANELTQIL